MSRAAASRQRRFKTGERVDNLYFGTPGLANIVADVSEATHIDGTFADCYHSSPTCNLEASH